MQTKIEDMNLEQILMSMGEQLFTAMQDIAAMPVGSMAQKGWALQQVIKQTLTQAALSGAIDISEAIIEDLLEAAQHNKDKLPEEEAAKLSTGLMQAGLIIGKHARDMYERS